MLTLKISNMLQMALDLNISGSIRPRHDLPKFGSFTCPRLQPAFGSNKQLYCTTRCSTAAQCATQHTAYFASTGGVVLLQPLFRLLRGKTGGRHPLNLLLLTLWPEISCFQTTVKLWRSVLSKSPWRRKKHGRSELFPSEL